MKVNITIEPVKGQINLYLVRTLRVSPRTRMSEGPCEGDFTGNWDDSETELNRRITNWKRQEVQLKYDQMPQRPKEHKLSEHLMNTVRQRLGLEEGDTSKDPQIKAMAPQQIVRHYFAWHIGDSKWGDAAIAVVEQAFNIKLKDPSQ